MAQIVNTLSRLYSLTEEITAAVRDRIMDAFKASGILISQKNVQVFISFKLFLDAIYRWDRWNTTWDVFESELPCIRAALSVL